VKQIWCLPLSVAHTWVSPGRAARGPVEYVDESGLLPPVVPLMANGIGPPFCLCRMVLTFPLGL
jgi:hypothetical protein